MRRSAFIFLLVLLCGLARAATNGEGYIGCYADAAAARDFSFLIRGGSSTPSICRSHCSEANYDYFGLQAGGQCFCGDSYGRYQKSSNCNNACSADSNFICGGPSANSVYSVKIHLDHVKLASRIDALTNEQLHAGLALMRDLIPAGFDAQTLVGHIRNGTVPPFTTSQIQVVKRSQLPPTSLARRDSGDLVTCISDILSVGMDVFSFVVSLLGVFERLDGGLNFLQMTANEASSFVGLLKIVSESTSAWESAKAIAGLFFGFINLAGLKSIAHMVTAHMTWWDYVKTAVSLVAQFTIWFTTDGAALIAEMVVVVENTIDLVLDAKTAYQDCSSLALPGPISLPPPTVQLAVMEQLNGSNSNIDLFLLDIQGSIHHRFQLPDLSWTDWEQFTHSKNFSRLAAARNVGGNLEVYGIGSDQALWQKFQVNTSPTRAWSGWNSFGGSLSEIAAVTNTWGTLEVFASQTDSSVRHIYQSAPSSSWVSWSTLNNSPLVKKFAMMPNKNGFLELFGLRTDGGVSRVRQGASSWENWGDFQASGVSDLVATRSQDVVEVFSIGSDKRVYHRWQNGANSYSWVDWVPLYSPDNSQLTKQAKQLAVTQQSDGRPILFLIGLDDAVYFTALTTSGWSAWQSLGGPASTIKAITNKAGIVQVYGIFAGDKNVYSAQQLKSTEPLKWSNWVPLN